MGKLEIDALPRHPRNVPSGRDVPTEVGSYASQFHTGSRHIPKQTRFSSVLQSRGRGPNQPELLSKELCRSNYNASDTYKELSCTSLPAKSL